MSPPSGIGPELAVLAGGQASHSTVAPVPDLGTPASGKPVSLRIDEHTFELMTAFALVDDTKLANPTPASTDDASPTGSVTTGCIPRSAKRESRIARLLAVLAEGSVRGVRRRTTAGPRAVAC